MSTHHHQHHHKHQAVEHPRTDAAGFHDHFGSGAGVLPPGPFAEAYRIAGYQDGLVGATPASDMLKPHWDSGLRWPDANNRQPGDFRWGAGVAGGVTWDGSFHRDLARYPAGGPLFWTDTRTSGHDPLAALTIEAAP